ncbi:hypothetical protein [uncultured Clostridium sp.]|uniref:hypothetical protein n=1 Tax=uncultured Clostridium sp. TaxID=59620 RepID=UPI0026ED6FB9|nr:hypothetical protein [uncultured Clostridium sp.]
MPKTLKEYKDKEKAKAYRKRNRDRYYNKNIGDLSRSGEPWQKWEDYLIINSKGDVIDRDIAKLLHRSLRAIQSHRSKLIRRY